MGYTIDCADETITVSDGYEVYTAQTGGTGITSGSISGYAGSTIYIRKAGTDNYAPSGWTAITIPARLAAPAAPSVASRTDTSITVTAVEGQEYSLDGTTWQDSGTFTGLTAGQGYTVHTRAKATATAFASESSSVTVTTKASAPAAPAVDGSYTVSSTDGSKFTYTVTPVAGAEYSQDGTTWQDSNVFDGLAPESSQTFYVRIRETEAAVAGNMGSKTVTLNKLTTGSGSVTLEGWTYGGAAKTPVPVSATHGTGNVTYSYQGINYTASPIAPADAGDYTVTATFAATAVYAQVTATANFTIAKAPVSFTVTDNAYTYDGAEKAATVTQTAGQTPGQFTVSYKQGSSEVTPKSAGTYEVWVTLNSDNFKFDGQADTVREMNVGTLTIEKKTVLAVWTNLTQVYDGMAKVLTISLSGLVQGDNCTATASAGPNAGTYPIELSLSGGAAGNYTASNPTATLTIQKAPVTFTVTDNSAQYDGSAHTATVTAAPNVAHTVTYRLNGQSVAAPTEAGTYEVWAEITDANYRHADAADGGAQKIGVLTIYRQTAPATYTATFAGGDGATGTAPPPQSGLLAGAVLVLPNAGGLTKADHAFAGWKLGNAVYQSGETYTMPAGNITFTAQWKTNVYTISGVVDQNDLPLDHVTVTLMLGGQQIAETVTDGNGEYTFHNVIPGIYNLVVSRDGVTMTIKVEITDQNASANIHLPAGKTNSVVEVKPGAATAVVGNLETVFTDDTVYTSGDQTVVGTGGSVEIKLTVDKANLSETDARAIQQAAGGYTLGQELALTVEKTVTESGGVTSAEPISDTGVLLETTLLLPAELQGKDSYAVYRLHDGEVHTLTAVPNEAGEYIEISADKTAITIHARYYSEYVIAWRQYSYGGGGTAAYPIALPDSTPDGGTVSVSPKSAPKGSTITITVDPDDGYELDQLTVKDRNGNTIAVTAKGGGQYTFEMPSGGVTIEVTFKESVWNRNYGDCPKDNTCPIWPYTDARMTDWYHDGVHFCLENGLMVGYGDGIFGPNAPTTRAMLAMMLWRLEGCPAVNCTLDLEDVKAGVWYTEAVRWTASQKLIRGYGNGNFGPSDTLTREQMATILYRYAQYKGNDVSAGEDTNILSFGDATTVAEYAIPAMQWACGSGMITGKNAADGSGLILAPKGSTTRAEMATMVMRFFTENVK